MRIAPVRAATTEAIILSGEQTVGGVAVVAGDRVLVKDQADAVENGVYAAAVDAWPRAADFDEPGVVVEGSCVLVIDAEQVTSAWVLTTPDPIVVGTTPLEWRAFPDLSTFVTRSGAQTLSGKTFSGETQFVLNGGRIGITSDGEALAELGAVVQVRNDNCAGIGLNVRSLWEGASGSPFVNNDSVLFETYTKTQSDSANRSWAASCANAYHDIPAGVTDSGERVGIIGWAGSVAVPGYLHAGTLATQRGVLGTAGYQGAGSANTAVIGLADGVAGLIYADSPGSTIELARAGAFASDGGQSVIETNIGVYARARNGTVANYAFYGDGGTFYNHGKMVNLGQVATGSEFSESSSSIAARKGGNSLEFGYPDVGYASNLGASFSHGYPFLAFCAEVDPAGDTFRTRGKKGAVVWSDLGGSLIFSRLAVASASGQSLTESARFDADGHLRLSETPVLKQKAPASAGAAGVAGEVCWDASYLYFCVATDSWKRVELSSW